MREQAVYWLVYLKIFASVFLIVLPGMVFSRFSTRVESAALIAVPAIAICGNREGCSNIAYPELVIHLLPTGATGLLLAVTMAALMSSLASNIQQCRHDVHNGRLESVSAESV